jgi:hypothetical protein
MIAGFSSPDDSLLYHVLGHSRTNELLTWSGHIWTATQLNERFGEFCRQLIDQLKLRMTAERRDVPPGLYRKLRRHRLLGWYLSRDEQFVRQLEKFIALQPPDDSDRTKLGNRLVEARLYLPERVEAAICEQRIERDRLQSWTRDAFWKFLLRNPPSAAPIGGPTAWV